MSPPPLPAPTEPRVPAPRPPVASRILSGLIVLGTGIATPFVAIIALTMTFILFGAATSSSTTYTGGAGGLLMYFCFVATPFVCLFHLAAATGALSLRLARWVWLATCLYTLTCWLALLLRAAGGTTDSTDAHRSWLPLIALLLVTTVVCLTGAVLTLFYRSDSSSIPLYPSGLQQ